MSHQVMDHATETTDKRFPYQVREFKLFTFSSLHGKYQVKDKKIIFRSEVCLEVASPDAFMIRKLKNNLQNYGMDFGQNHIKLEFFIPLRGSTR